jgi:hypothetical protein
MNVEQTPVTKKTRRHFIICHFLASGRLGQDSRRSTNHFYRLIGEGIDLEKAFFRRIEYKIGNGCISSNVPY